MTEHNTPSGQVTPLVSDNRIFQLMKKHGLTVTTLDGHANIEIMTGAGAAKAMLDLRDKYEVKFTELARLLAESRQHEEALESTLHFAASYTGIEGRACPLCKYENGKFIERCQMHKEVDELRAKVAEAWQPVPDGEYPMVENAEMDGDFLYITGNEDLEICTWVERPIETIMLDLGMKIMRLAPAAQDAGDGAGEAGQG